MNGTGEKLAACLAAWCIAGCAVASGGTQIDFQLPMSAREEAEQVAGVCARSGAVLLGLGPVEAGRQFKYFQRDYSDIWQEASLQERRLLSEKIGEQGAKRLVMESQPELGRAEQRLGFSDRAISQGPDRGYWLPRTGTYLVVESKGGGSSPKTSYNAKQGTNLNTLRSTAGALKKLAESGEATLEELVEHWLIMLAAEEDRLATGVSKTTHNGGKPQDPKWDGPLDKTSVAREAEKKIKELLKNNPELKEAHDEAKKILRSLVWKQRIGQVFTGLGIFASGALGWEAYLDWSMASQEWTSPAGESLQAVFLTARAVARTGEEVSLAAGLSATLAHSFGYTGKLVNFGGAAGKAFLPFAITVAGLDAAVAYNDFVAGRISQRDWYRASSGPAIFFAFTTAGAAVGATLVAVPTAGLLSVPGAVLGAEVGALLALPLTVATEWWWENHYSAFDAKKQAAVRESIANLYR